MFAKADHRANCGQAYVAKAANFYEDRDKDEANEVFERFATGQMFAGAGACAVVELSEETYSVITFEKERADKTHVRTIKEGVHEILMDVSSGYGL